MDANPRLGGLAPRDRAFVHILVATTLRRLGQIDDLIARFVTRAPTSHAAELSAILRISTCQLAFLGTPAHAAVDAAVRLARAAGTTPQAGFVNAVLRRIATDTPAILSGQDAPRLNTPDWLWQSWVASYSESVARAIAAAHLTEPPLDLTLRAESALWAGRLGGALLASGSLRLQAAGPIRELPGYDEGGWWVQDAAAALPALILLSALGASVDHAAVADLCAAPGGKTAQLAASGARVIAVEQNQARLDRLAANLHRIGLSAQLVAADVASWHPAAPLDAVLLDAPCTATGTIRRHPDIARRKTARDIGRQAALQAGLLAAAALLVRPGGILVYSVCSLQPEEGLDQITRLLAATPGYVRLPIMANEIGGLEAAITTAGDVQTLPCHLAEIGGIDGFYIARLRRTV